MLRCLGAGAIWGALVTVSGGCSAPQSATAPAPATAPVEAAAPAATPAPNEASPGEAAQPHRVLVTGFNDWNDLGAPPNLWRCRDNPSCRVLLGDAADEAPSQFEGPLATKLRASAGDTEWVFATLPVTWGVAEQRTEYPDYDVVVHLGLGVYDRTDAIFVEDGAFNGRRGKDASGKARSGAIGDEASETLAAPPQVSTAVRALNGRNFGAYRIEVKAAREANSYLCNETNFAALTALSQSAADGGRLSAAFFVHIPYADDALGGYDALASALADIVQTLAKPASHQP